MDQNNSNKGTGWLATGLSVLAAAFGVQSQSALERDFKQGSLFQFVVAGLLGTALFVLSIYLAVQWLLSGID